MKTKTKALVLALCAVLLVVTTVFVTMAFLTSEDSVQNTFTVGKVVICLDEAQVNTAGEVVSGGDRTKTDSRVDNNKYHLIPGHLYTKDPTIHVDANSEDCWLFVKLENALKDIIDDKTIEDQMKGYGWSYNEVYDIWFYNTTVKGGANIEVFDNFKIKGEAEVSGYATEDDEKIVIKITAYAVQVDNFNTALEAWKATFGAE